MPTPIITVMLYVLVIMVVLNVLIVIHVLVVMSILIILSIVIITIISLLSVILNVLIMPIIAIKAYYATNMVCPGYDGYMAYMACVCGGNSSTNTIYNTCATYNDCMGCMATNIDT